MAVLLGMGMAKMKKLWTPGKGRGQEFCIPEDTPNYLLSRVPGAACAEVGGGAINLPEKQSSWPWATSEKQCSSALVTGGGLSFLRSQRDLGTCMFTRLSRNQWSLLACESHNDPTPYFGLYRP